MERLRERIVGTLDADLIRQREAEGWRLAAVEWERGEGASNGAFFEVPFGFRIARDCRHLEEDPDESEVLRSVMQAVVNDRPLSHIAAELNRRGFRTRTGLEWNPASVFRLMPALVDSGPRIFSEPDWPSRRRVAV